MQFIQNSLIPEEELEPMRRLFKSIDQDYDYTLTKSEFEDGLKQMGLGDAQKVADQVFKLVDTNDSGNIQFSEFCTATLNHNQLF